MVATLKFSLAHDSTYREAQFRKPEYKDEYVEAEFSDLRTQDAYHAFQAASIKQRKDYARKLDAARYAFFIKWSKQKENRHKIVRDNVSPLNGPDLPGDRLA